MRDIGFVHGRFQPFHNDHLVYVMAALERCRHLVIGISNPDPTLSANEELDPGRLSPMKNPFTYFERMEMVNRTMHGAGVNPERISIVPFPVSFPELYRYYIPDDAVFFMTVYDAWGRRKAQMFKEAGRVVEIMWNRPIEEKGITASEVRDAMLRDLEWKNLVSPQTARVMDDIKGVERIKETAGFLS